MPEEDKKADASLLEEMSRTSKLLVRRDLELRKVNEELDEKINKLEESEAQLKEMNVILEIRLKARTRQLLENIDDLDRQVKERTKKIEESKEKLSILLEDLKKEKLVAEEEKEKTIAIIKNFPDGLLVFDNENNLTVINAEAERFLGMEGRQVVGRSAKDLMEMSELSSLFGIIGADVDEVFRIELAISNSLILEVSVDSIVRSGEKMGKFVILHDITREKTVERLKSEFVSIAAHQLRTPLTSIKWMLTSFIEGDFGDLSTEQMEYIKKTNLSNERMINLVDNLLNLSRIEEGRYIQRIDRFDLEDLVQKNMEAVKFKMKKKQIKISFQDSGKPVEVSADKEKISLVVQNLIENAINYSFEGGEINISLKVDEDKQSAIFKVQDNGIGIPEDQKDRIFTKFFRSKNAVQAQTVGSGLGLFINKNIIESHGGQIWFSSEENKGALFCFSLPLEAKSGAADNGDKTKE